MTRMSIINFLHKIREIELTKAICEMPSPKKTTQKISLLEIGSGTGRQANILERAGFNVTAIDIPSSSYRTQREFNVVEYDGANLPCKTQSIQIAFSSNVLEHIAHIENFLVEIHRVLDGNGQAIHILPTTSWRFWSTITHYGWATKKTFLYLKGLVSPKMPLTTPVSLPSSSNDLVRILFPARHGERGNILTEMYYFSEYWWKRKFTQNGFVLKKVIPNGLFYTDSSLFGESISFKNRAKIAKYLGSSCKIYILEKSSPTILVRNSTN